MTELHREDERWIAPSRGGAEVRLRLFCLPYAGSGAAGYFRWRRLLPGWIEVCPVLLPGRETRLAEPAALSVDELAEPLVRSFSAGSWTDKPFAIFGHSMGALIAYEWARALKQAGLPEPVTLLVSGRAAPQHAFGHRNYHRMPDQEMLEALLSRYGGVPGSMFTDPDLREIFLPILRADLTLVETYRWRSEPKLNCPIVAFCGEHDSTVRDEGLLAWRELTTGTFQQARLPGDHFYHFGQGQKDLLSRVDSVLEALA